MLIEIRIGFTKRKMASLISYVQNQSKISSSKIHRVPHITLYGNFNADYHQFQEIRTVIESVCKRYGELHYIIDGFDWFPNKNGKVIYFKIKPSKELVLFREQLASKLLKIVPSYSSYDRKKDFTFHSTLAYKLTNSEFNRIWSIVSNRKSLFQKLKIIFGISGSENQHQIGNSYLPSVGLRITLLNNESKIVYEYDFIQKRFLSRLEALSKNEWSKTLRYFRIKKGMENCYDNRKTTYVISDLHLDHENIIRYCSRPFLFSDVDEMNKVLVNNWNNTVKDNTIFFLGDLSFGRGARSADEWLKNLRGKIVFIRGNHEVVENSKEYEILKYGNHSFLLVHDPHNLPIKWKEWVIHGHKHNNEMKEYPFINGINKTINVSAELLNYKPISFEDLLSLDIDSIRRMDTVDSVPERK